ncbi:hypothetical protein TWF106_002965 [Orbilia oligospora]|uniref:Uncharacterized protein n=1 Tax=Orbilia oligospora TaxID=2813651 RepID=A0A6G1MD04_ORBOL|nr:hypothetical protein TWF788_005215 [Orbilia oligospora]KAF3223097.1 hypothetical protein TWF679_004293 [Orbilia oligospora]KAF3225085.1 hypothetical protein TWF106_002965 [Orbilia oligospora]KAF3226390.1 hypothetical protein TWF191_004652 [Orbilia oligospora]KAF3252563.1 hypothetical protein TWF192_004365 [Orbilia oligospora]
MVEADPTGYFTSKDRLPLGLCPGWRRIRTKYSRYCDQCETKIQEDFRKQKEEERKKNKQKKKDMDGYGSDGTPESYSSAGSADSWQLVIQAPSVADVPLASTSSMAKNVDASK